MRCPYCRHADSRVVDSRETEDGQLIRRRRACPECGRRFTTVEEAILAVVKRSGVTEPFSRTKVIAGVRKACQGRPVDDDALALLAQKVEDTVRARGCAEIPSNEVGLVILGPLRELDEVAYLRFASVYRSFDSLEDFEREIATLRVAAAEAVTAETADAIEAATGGDENGAGQAPGEERTPEQRRIAAAVGARGQVT
jgi:transcriptional repressor NrdR